MKLRLKSDEVRMRRWVGRLAIYMLAASMATAARAQEGQTEVGGSLRMGGYGLVPFGKDVGGDYFDPTGIAYDRIRLKIAAEPTDVSAIDIQLDTHLAFGTPVLMPTPLYGATAGAGNARMSLGVYRASGTLRQGEWDFRAGIQRVAWGVGQLFNPSNIFSHLSFADPTQELVGIPAFVVRRPLGPTGELTLVSALDPQTSQGNAGFHAVYNVWEVDWGVTASYSHRYEQFLAGWNIKGDAEVGYWSEGRWARAVGRHDGGTWRAETGLDYSFAVSERTLYVSAEHYYRSEGAYTVSTPAATGLGVALAGSTDGSLAGKHYGYLTVRYDATDELAVMVSGLGNLTDPSAIVFPYAALAWVDDLDIYLGAVIPAAPKGSEFNPSAPAVPTGVPAPVLPKLTVAALAFADMHF